MWNTKIRKHFNNFNSDDTKKQQARTQVYLVKHVQLPVGRAVCLNEHFEGLAVE